MNLLFWLGTIVAATSHGFAAGIVRTPDPATWITGVSLGITLVWFAQRSRSAASLFRSVAIVTAGIAWCIPAVWLVHWIGARMDPFDWIARLFELPLRTLGFAAFTDRAGVLHVDASAHLVPVAITWQNLGLAPTLWIALHGFAALALLRCPRPVNCALRLLGICTIYVWLRFLVMLVVIMNLPDPMNLQVGEHGVATSIFTDPLLVGFSFAPLAAFFARWLPWTRAELRVRPLVPLLRPRSLLATAAVGAFAFALPTMLFDLGDGQRKQGRVLLDEFHSQGWETVLAKFDSESFGRSALYNYASLADLLNHHYDLSINVASRYDSEMLSTCDVLVIKTPTLPFEPGEVEAITEFVRGGGGLYLIGDHTDLLGMSTNINQLALPFGIEFRTDAVNRLEDGQFLRYEAPHLFPHPIMAATPRLGFMTSCSLDVPLTAQTVIAAGNSFSDPLDFSQPSFFGNVIPDFEDACGVRVICAAQDADHGRVVAFGDSTIFSNFGLFYEGRAELLLRSIEFLNTTRHDTGRGVLWLAIAALLALLASVRGCPTVWLSAVAGPVGAGAFVTAIAIAWISARDAIDLPVLRADRSDREVAVLYEGVDFELPDALVPTEVPAWRQFDALFVGLQRIGRFPRLCTFDQALSRNTLIVINPNRSLTRDQRLRLDRWVSAGGHLCVLDTIHNAASSANEFLTGFGLGIARTTVAHTNLFADPDWLANKLVEGGDGRIDFGPIRAQPIGGEQHLPALTLRGGTGLVRASDGQHSAAIETHGNGRVIAVVDSITFSGEVLGRSCDEVEPGGPRHTAYQRMFALLSDYLLGEAVVQQHSSDASRVEKTD